LSTDRHLKDPHRERRIFAARTVIAGLFVLVLTGCLMARLYYLQMMNHSHFQTLSDKNRMQLQSVPPTRGLIYDRNGILLADNQPVFSVAIVPERAGDTEAALAAVTRILQIEEDQIERFRARLLRPRRPHQSVILKSKLTEEEIARIEVRRHELKGVEIEAELARHYPFGELTAHAIGYVGRINERELEQVDQNNYSATNYIGKLGVEHFYESVLHGIVGYRTVETNARNRVLRVLDQQDPVPGANLTLHMDIELQRRIHQLMAGKRGSVVAIEPESGGVLALVSTPSFDPNLFVTGIDFQSYAALRDSLDLPLFNRALKGRYPPGSTIKPIIGLGGLDSGTITPEHSIWDPGWYQLRNDERFYRDWKREGHGRVDLKQAIAQSCDTYFYDLAFRMGVDEMSKYLGYFGFGENRSYDLEEAREGILPSRDWKRGVKGLPWFPGDSLNLGIGQGFMLATPLQLASATAILANRGFWRPATMLRSASTTSIELPSIAASELNNVPISRPEHWDFIFSAMAEVMHGAHGTARSSGRKAGYRIAGKTGTAQVVGIKQGEEYDAEALAERHRDHALFIGFAPVDAPRIAVSVIVENGGGGSGTAAPIARQVFDFWLARSAGRDEDVKGMSSREQQP
jgi:penicillin-binding protein 2